MPWFRLIPLSVWIPFSLSFLLLFHIPIANANHSGLTSRHGGCIGTWSGFTPCIFYTLPLTYIHPLLELQQVSQGEVVLPSHNKADNTFKRGFKPVSVPVGYLAHATPLQRRASAPPEAQKWTWNPTSAPRHRAATPDRWKHASTFNTKINPSSYHYVNIHPMSPIFEL